VPSAGDPVVVRLPERFEQFYGREYSRVVGFAYALAGSWEAAEDAAQEAFLRAHREWARVGRYDQPGAWVLRVAANLAVSAFRRRLTEARALVHLAARRQPDPPLEGEAVDFWRAVRALPGLERVTSAPAPPAAPAPATRSGRPTPPAAGCSGSTPGSEPPRQPSERPSAANASARSPSW
jgi:Sigma-70 region 2